MFSQKSALAWHDGCPSCEWHMRPLVELLQSFAVATPSDRRDFLEALVRECHVRELSDLEAMLLPRLKVDFLQRLPMDVALHILTFLDDPRALACTAAVSRTWHRLSMNEYLWSLMCVRQRYHTPDRLRWLTHSLLGDAPSTSRAAAMDVDEGPARRRRRHSLFLQRVAGSPAEGATVSLRDYFRLAYAVDRNWRRGGRLLRSYETIELADADPDPNRRLALTCCAMDHEWTAVGMTSSAIFVFSTRTGKLVRVLRGHESGVWCLMLATGPSSGYDGPYEPPATAGLVCAQADKRPGACLALQPSGGLAVCDAVQIAQEQCEQTDVACASTRGWDESGTRLVSAGSDRSLRVWNVRTGECERVMHGHTSTIRCVHVVPHVPVAITGSRDGTLRVWDLAAGRVRHVLAGHQHSVRCLAVHDKYVASGSYDFTCRVWDWTTGRCVHVLQGHQLQIYAIAFDGVHIATGSSDSTVRVWDSESGAPLAVFHGYTHIVAQLQLLDGILASGSSDGRVVVYSLRTMECLYRIVAHESGVTSLQMDAQHLVTAGSDGLVKLWDAQTGSYVRQMCAPCETVWNVRFLDDVCVILGKRHGKCIVDMVSLRPAAESTYT